jgi:taurine dioxygenase
MRNTQIEVWPITPRIGAVIEGVDLSTSLSDETFDQIYAAFLEHQVIFLPNQEITPSQQVAFAKRFGEIDEPHPLFKSAPEDSRIMRIEQSGKEGDYYNDVWHTDVSFQERPAMASVLHAQVLPAVGSDTLWASMYAAYDALSYPIKLMLEGLTAVHDLTYSHRTHYPKAYRLIRQTEPGGLARLRKIEDEHPPVSHPIIRTHPVTKRKALYVNRTFTERINGLSKIESDALLAMLLNHCESPMFQMRHRWSRHDLAIWDNRCTQHVVISDFYPQKRLMHRVTIKGDRPS